MKTALALAIAVLIAAPARGRAAEAAHADSAKMPKPTSISYQYDAIDQAFLRPVSRVGDAALLVRKVSGQRREAENVDERDQVRLPSTWWQPRLGYRETTVGQMLHGPGSGAGPAPGRWKIVKAKTQGVTPGFQIKDSNGDRFAIKFDPPKFPEMATGAEVVATYLYWAAGYNVPENTIADIAPDELDIDSSVVREDKKPFTRADLDAIFAKAARRPDGRYRVVASRFLKGKPLGEWEYKSRRKDDPEDLVPHQFRREIRGLWAINAWTNHVDCSARNTLDMWVTDGGRSFVRHYLIDFSSCLGSSSITQKGLRHGSEYLLDYGSALHSTAMVGLHRQRWDYIVDPHMPSVGLVESDVFDAGRWRPFLPNPAFDDMTERDVRWGASIVAAFTDDHIRAAVEQGRYSDPRAAEYLTRVLIERRDKIVHRWLGDAPSLRRDGEGARSAE